MLNHETVQPMESDPPPEAGLPAVIELPELNGEIYTRRIEVGPPPGLRLRSTEPAERRTLRRIGWRPPAGDVPPMPDDTLRAMAADADSPCERWLAGLVLTHRTE